MSALTIAILVSGNVALIYVLLAMPLGERLVTLSRRVRAPRERLWNALWPLGTEAFWSGSLLKAESLPDKPGDVRLMLSWEGRNGEPIERTARLENVERLRRFSMRFVDDSSLDPGFWRNYREDVLIEDAPNEKGGRVTLVTLSRRDRYRGLAFLVFRYFALRREIVKLKRWAETGIYRRGGIFEHPLTQLGFAALSALLLWPLFGLNLAGFIFSVTLTSVVALHELGHMAAFRLIGHRSARMIFIPLLGGVAIGGRPYDNRFEAAFVALMGAGFSAFLVPPSIVIGLWLQRAGYPIPAGISFTLAGCASLFNLANLIPIWKFDGGQVLRQICPNAPTLAAASFLLLCLALLFGHFAGFSGRALFIAGILALVLSLLTAGISVRPRHELKPISSMERAAVAGALVAVFTIHGCGLIWAIDKLT